MQLETLFTEMANALRTKEETTGKISAESFPQRINDLKVLDTTDATATADDVVAGKIVYANGKRVIGTIIDNGALEYTPSDEEQIIPTGLTSGGIVKAVDITPFTSDATATAEDIAEGKTAYVNGQKLVGTNNYVKTIVSKTEPTGNDRVKIWIQKTRNLITNQSFDIASGNGSNKTFSDNTIKTTSTGTWGWKAYEIDIPSNLLNREMCFSFDGVCSHEYLELPGIPAQVRVMPTSNLNVNPTAEQRLILTTEKQRYSFKFIPTQTTMYFYHYCTSSGNHIVTIETSNHQLELGNEATEYNEYITPVVYIKDDVTDVYSKFGNYSDIF